MKPRRIFEFVLAGAFVLALSGCQTYNPTPTPSSLTPTMDGSSQGETAFLWLAADKDAWVGCRAQNCADGDLNHGTLFSLDVSDPAIPPGTTRIYVEFYLPELPDGTQVEEAYINLYEDSRQIPGNEGRPVIRVLQEWDPRTINHNNQPMAIGYLSEDARLGRFRDVNEWRGTFPFSSNLASIVQNHLDDPDSNHGFLVNNPSNITYLRSFRSDNALSRTETDMDFSPRLLIKVRLPDGPESYLGPSNVVLPPLPPDTDLDENLAGPDVLMVRIAGGATWPASWDVAFD